MKRPFSYMSLIRQLCMVIVFLVPSVAQEALQEPLTADLDALLDFERLWQWRPEDLAAHYTAKASEGGDEDGNALPFAWVNAARDRARFSRKMFRNAETRLTLFGGAVRVEEAIVEFEKGRAVRVNVSFYNRGDSGEISLPEFERIFRTVGQGLGRVLQTSPRSILNASASASKLVTWGWTSPRAVVLLEHNDYSAKANGGREVGPEFLRMKLAAPGQNDWSMGRLSTGVGRIGMAANVSKTSEGDVYIANVPMVDQGEKGYCVAAACQRLFEYLQVPCDQHELANLVNVDARSGVDIFSMQKSLKKVVTAYRLNFKAHVNPELYYDSRRQRRVSVAEFKNILKDHAGKGMPLLWALELGKFPEEPPLPVTGQTLGGHMRMIIGYNEARNQVLFTDTWGAGHELKRMHLPSAWEVTIGLYSMTPR